MSTNFNLLKRFYTLNSLFRVPRTGFNKLTYLRHNSSALSYPKHIFRRSTSVSGNDLIKYRCSGLRYATDMPLPGILHDWSLNLTPEELLTKTDSVINRCRALYDTVGSVPDAEVSSETVLKVLNDAEIILYSERFFLEVPQHISTDEGVRNASTEADRKIREFCVEVGMRKDIFEKLLILQQKKEPLKPQAQRYLDVLILLGKRNGLHLDEETRKKVKELNTKLNNLAIDFSKNLTEVTTTLEFSEQELEGVSADFLKNLKKNPDTGKAEVTLKYPHYFPIMEKCKVPKTRKRIEFAFNTQCLVENSRILSELRKARHELATLLSYPSHSAYKIEKLMSKTTENVQKFLSDLAEKLAPLWVEEKKSLLQLKEKECSELGVPFDGKLNSYDMTYYTTLETETKYAVDKEKLREYFSLPVVKKGLLEIYQDLLGLKFEQVTGDVWHEDVELYSVTDTSSGTLLGYFFLDLFPRPNKYGHAALFEMQHGYIRSNGSRQIAVGGMVANFTKPTKDKPALLDHDEVVTFFHEFGHVMHYLCIETEYPYFYIMNMERDFLEAPSQMLENWCWEKESLQKMSSHYLDGSSIPEDMLESLVKSRKANVGYSNLRQINLSLYDQRIHTNPEGGTSDLFFELTRQIVGIEPQEGTSFPCHFGHLANDYDAQYYGYLWSEVYSMDMFQTKFAGGNILNPEVGMEYRNKILWPGATKDARDLIADFLGREPTEDAFLRSKGLKI